MAGISRVQMQIGIGRREYSAVSNPAQFDNIASLPEPRVLALVLSAAGLILSGCFRRRAHLGR